MKIDLKRVKVLTQSQQANIKGGTATGTGTGDGNNVIILETPVL